MKNKKQVYRIALSEAVEIMNRYVELEPTSALKQAAANHGIPYGEEMGEFVAWANAEIFQSL